MNIKSAVLKTALVGTMMLANIAPPSDDYFEDDQDFTTQSSNMLSGWGWLQLSSAKAAGTEIITVTGRRLPAYLFSINWDGFFYQNLLDLND